MKNYTNKQGYILAITIAIIYAFISQENFDFYTFLGSIIGALLINTILSGFISIFWKFKNFGKVIGITSLIVCIMAFFGNRKYDVEQKEKVEIEKHNLNTITANFKNVLSNFNSKLQTDSRKDILNNLIISNKLFDGDINEISNQLNEADKYYSWIKNSNDSLFTDFKMKLNNYKEELKDDRKKREIERYIMQLQMSEINTTVNYMHETNIIWEMRNMLSIRKKCKHEFKNGKLLFSDTNCLENWKKAEIKLNEALNNLNLQRENLKNK